MGEENVDEELPPPVPPGVPRVGKGQVLLQAISSAALPTDTSLCIAQCVSCTADAQLPSFSHSITVALHCFQSVPAYGSQYVRRTAAAAFTGVQSRYMRGRGLVPGLPLSASVPTPGASHLPPNLSASQWTPSAMRCCISLGTQVAFHHAAQYVCAVTQV